MAKIQTKSKIPPFFSSYFMLFVYAAVATSLLVSSFIMSVKAFETKKNADIAKDKYTDTYLKNEYLKEKSSSFDDEYAAEKIIREEYRAILPGEEIVVITDQVEDIDPEESRGFFWRLFH